MRSKAGLAAVKAPTSPDLPQEAPKAVETPEARIAALEAQLAEVTQHRDSLGNLLLTVADGLQAIRDRIVAVVRRQ